MDKSFREFVQEWVIQYTTKRGWDKSLNEDDLAYEFAEEAVTSFPFEVEEFEKSDNKEIDDFYKAMIPLITKLVPEYLPSLGM